MADEPDPSEEFADRLKSIRNERAKLMATYFNGLAIAVIVVGAFSPAFADKAPGEAGTVVAAAKLAFCIGTSFTLHIVGRLALGAIR